MRRYREYDVPRGPLEPRDPLPTEQWLWAVVIVLLTLAALGAIFG